MIDGDHSPQLLSAVWEPAEKVAVRLVLRVQVAEQGEESDASGSSAADNHETKDYQTQTYP